MALPYHALQHRAFSKLPIAEQALLQEFLDAFPLGLNEDRSYSDPVPGLYEDVSGLKDAVAQDPERYQKAVHEAIARQRDVASKFGLTEMRQYDEVVNDPNVVVGYAEAAAEHYRQACREIAQEELTLAFTELKPFLDQVPEQRVREDIGGLIADSRTAPAGYLLAALAARGPAGDMDILLTEIASSLGGEPLQHVAQLEQVEECISWGRPGPALTPEVTAPATAAIDAPDLSDLD
jgi:hypothetical protein